MRAKLTVVALLLSTGAANPAETYRVVGLNSNEVLQIRETPSVTAKILGTLPHDGTVLAFGCTSRTPSGTTWCRVKKGRIVGWASRKLLAPYPNAGKGM
jgi:hypothetical protein